jgi:hypothetical protein
MAAAWKVLWVCLILVVPGGLFVLAAYALTRSWMDAWRRANAAAAGNPIHFKNVVEQVRFRDTYRQMKTSFSGIRA